MPVKNLHDHANMLVTLLNYIFNFILTNALNLFQTLLKRAAYFNSWCNKNPELENPAIPPIPWDFHRSFSHCWGLHPELPFLLWIANYLDEEDNKKISDFYSLHCSFSRYSLSLHGQSCILQLLCFLPSGLPGISWCVIGIAISRTHWLVG